MSNVIPMHGPLWRCANCGWTGRECSLTEDKIVTEIEGMTVVERPVYAVCPECFARVERIGQEKTR